ncbi:hypothetical protein, partial [Neisseria sicca]|uniref:hypothetical protein n=1 Tax=Neisseria sicca TaxID=490 RepID=UPI001C9929E3
FSPSLKIYLPPSSKIIPITYNPFSSRNAIFSTFISKLIFRTPLFLPHVLNFTSLINIFPFIPLSLILKNITQTVLSI